MCGIAGWYSDRVTPSRETVVRMVDCLRHRGPDDSGFYDSEKVILGMRRLAVLDPEGSPQPITNEDGSVVAVCNGEIYNFRSLRRRLEEKGHRFGTRGDVEPAVHAYEEYGVEFLSHLRGMFALALWDDRRGRLLLARDRLGIKPLYYSRAARGVLFASEISSLLAGLDQVPPIDATAMGQFLSFGYVPAPRSIFRGVSKLQPGRYLTAADGGFEIGTYWEPPVDQDDAQRGVKARRRAKDLVMEAVEEELVSDVPLGLLLSGGVDSSVVAAAAAAGSSRPIRTFSVAFADDPEFDESRDARRVADHLGTEHEELHGQTDLLERIPEIVAHHGEPFGDPSSAPTLAVSELARSRVTVALSGDGGDELFGGYDRYLADLKTRWVDLLPAGIRRPAAQFLTSRMSEGAWGLEFLRSLELDRESRYLQRIRHRLDPQRGGLASQELFAEIDARDVTRPHRKALDRVEHRDVPTRLMYLDLNTYLPDDVLTKVDRMSMSCSLEVRPPLLDHRIVEFAMSLPLDQKIRGGQGKRILREAFEGDLPAEVFNRPKQGFALPIENWFRTQLRGYVEKLLDEDHSVSRFIHGPTVRRMIREHVAGRRSHAEAIWKVCILAEWLRWIEDGASPPAACPGSLENERISLAGRQP